MMTIVVIIILIMVIIMMIIMTTMMMMIMIMMMMIMVMVNDGLLGATPLGSGDGDPEQKIGKLLQCRSRDYFGDS